MSKRTRTRILRTVGRLTAMAAVIAAVAALPLDWGRLGQTASLLAAGMQQPSGAAWALCERLPTDAVQTVTPPVTNTQAEGFFGTETLPDLSAGTSPAPALPPYTMISPPKNTGDGGKVVELVMDTGNPIGNGIASLNRSGTSVNVSAALNKQLTLAFEQTDQPQVLILHTHTTEGYMTYDGGYYNSADRNRTQDHKKNVCAVGEAVRLALEAEGIAAIHDTTVHDSPLYSGAYNRSADTAAAYLEKYPSIKVVLDIHRDAVMQGDTDIVKPTATVEGKKAAQMMLITGVVSTADLPHPNWEQNLIFSTHLQKALCQVSSSLMRPLNTVASRYNQHLSTGWVLVEVGSEGNTMAEAVLSGQILGQTLARLLR